MKLAAVRRIAMLLAAAFAATSGASGYYFYTHFGTRTAPFNPIYEKFDVNALKNKTVNYSISDNGPSLVASGDSFTALISELRLAAKTWNDVDSSDLRLAFGGLATPGTAQSAPGIDVIFDDNIPPGIAALGGPTTRADVAFSANGQFVPILRSTLILRRDLRDSPSFSESFFLTLVHEFGHTLGLQHTLTSGTMSTGITRATTRSKPLSPDDVAAISTLYPTGQYGQATGTFSGRVTLGGSPVNLASVVAISLNGPAVSAMTNPDGTYTMQGVPAGQYYIYVHPLPDRFASESQPADIVPPKDPDGNPIPRATVFDTVFYPNTKDPNQATSFFVNPGDSKSNINFTVNRRNSPGLSSVVVYGLLNSTNFVYPAPVQNTRSSVTLYAYGNGLVNGSSVAPGISVNVLGQSGANIVANTLKYYRDGYIQFGIAPTFGSNTGPRHLVFTGNGDIYVLPAAVLLVANPPPSISGVFATVDDRGNRAVSVTGSWMDGSTRILFDGAAGTVLRQNGDGSLLVAPPSASGGFRTNVVALNSDGQSSLFLQPAPPQFLYDGFDSPSIALGTNSATAGTESMIEIIGQGTSFVDGQTVLGFGSSDVVVRRVWVTGPNRLLANIAVNAGAPPTATEVTVATGLQVVSQPFGFQILPGNSRQVSLLSPVTNALNGNAGVPAGGTAVVSVANLNTPAGGLGMTVGDQRATVVSVVNGQITFTVPAGLPVGPAIVRLQTANGDVVAPLIMNIDPPAPQIAAAFVGQNVPADASHPLVRGSLAGFLITNLPDGVDVTTLHISIGGFDHSVMSSASAQGGTLVQVLVNPFGASGNQVPVTLSYNGVVSAPFNVAIR